MTADAPAVRFFAIPNSPHLTHTYCGYTLMTLAGFSHGTRVCSVTDIEQVVTSTVHAVDTVLTSDQIEMVTINGVAQEFKPLSNNTIAVIPAFRQEAQMVKVYCKSRTSEGSIQNWMYLPSPPQNYGRPPSPVQNWTRLQPTPPDLSMGFTPAPHNIYRKAT